jgi:hypothetical protein
MECFPPLRARSRVATLFYSPRELTRPHGSLGLLLRSAPELYSLLIFVGRGPGFATPGVRSGAWLRPLQRARLPQEMGRPRDARFTTTWAGTNPESPECHESTIECQADLRKLQDRPPRREGLRDLHQSAAQAKTGLSPNRLRAAAGPGRQVDGTSTYSQTIGLVSSHGDRIGCLVFSVSIFPTTSAP